MALELIQYHQIADGWQGIFVLVAQQLFSKWQQLSIQRLSLTVPKALIKRLKIEGVLDRGRTLEPLRKKVIDSCERHNR